jgi:hypothetical protein
MSKKQEDLKFGFANESTMYDVLRKLPNCQNIVKTEDDFDAIDFESSDTFLELKSRRINHNKYPTALIGCNKIAKIKTMAKPNNYICWNYLDGLFYIEYDESQFSTLKPELQKVFRDGKWESSMVYKVPYQWLTLSQ